MSEDVMVGVQTWSRLCDAPVAGRLLDALEGGATFAPTHYGEDEFARLPYDRPAILARVGKAYTITVARKKAVKYIATFVATKGLHPSEAYALSFYTKGGCPPSSVPEAYALGDRLAAALKPEIAYVQPTGNALGDRAKAFGGGSGHSWQMIRDYGLPSLSARTWLGAELTARIGRDLLEKSGCVVREAPWGGVVVDLVPEPWKADVELLFTKQQAAQKVLRKSGMFGVYEGIDGIDTKPGPKWTPLAPPKDGG